MKNPFFAFLLIAFATIAISCQNNTSNTETDADMSEEETPASPVASTTGQGQAYRVDPAASVIQWEGYKPAVATTHTGTVKISEGTVTVSNGMVTGGTIVVDMNTITDTDLQGDSKAKLEAHLKGSAPGKEDDFFNVSKYPTGRFEITKVTALENDAEANTMIYGNLTLRDVTKPISFKANVTENNGVLTATSPMFKIDRTEWGIKVLSKKFFDNLSDTFVDDQFGLRIQLRANAAQNM